MWEPKNIPHVCHFYWGGSILSYLRYLTVLTFNKQNPDWKIKFYYPKKIYVGKKLWNLAYPEDVVGKDYTSEVSKIPNVEMIELDLETTNMRGLPDVYKSDILRLKILSTEGGICSDMDIIYFKPLSSTTFGSPDNINVDTIISYNPARRRKHYSIGFLGASENNPFYRFLYHEVLLKLTQKKVLKPEDKKNYQQFGTEIWNKYYNHPIKIEKEFEELTILDIAMWFVYPIDGPSIGKMINADTPIDDVRTVGLHWYGGHPKSKEWENKLAPNNINKFKNTITSTIKRALK